MVSFENKTDVVQFVDDLLTSFPSTFLSITTTPQGKFVVCFAPTVTNELLEDTEKTRASIFSKMQSST